MNCLTISGDVFSSCVASPSSTIIPPLTESRNLGSSLADICMLVDLYHSSLPARYFRARVLPAPCPPMKIGTMSCCVGLYILAIAPSSHALATAARYLASSSPSRITDVPPKSLVKSVSILCSPSHSKPSTHSRNMLRVLDIILIMKTSSLTLTPGGRETSNPIDLRRTSMFSWYRAMMLSSTCLRPISDLSSMAMSITSDSLSSS